MNIPTEFFTDFNDLTYYDEPHKYMLDGQELLSVTTMIHEYHEPFDEEYWSQYKAQEYNLTQEEVKRAWRFINKKGTMKGSIIHDYAENLLLNKVFKYPEIEIISEFGFDPIKVEYEITKKHVDKFCADTKGKLIPVKTELVMYDRESLVGGMADLIFYNVKAGEYQIWDHKTNKEFTHQNPERRLTGDLYMLEDSDLNIYSLQLSTYKHILEKNTGIKFGKSYVVWYSHKNPKYEIIEMKNHSYYVDIMMNNRIESLKAA